MSKYDVEMVYGVGVSLKVDADTEEDAIKKAKQIVEDEVSVIDGIDVDTGDMEFEQVTYINKVD